MTRVDEEAGVSGEHRSGRCFDGVHHFREMAICQCGIQASGPERAAGREGMVTVYDSWGRYLGCMGEQTWEDLIRDAEAEAVETGVMYDI